MSLFGKRKKKGDEQPVDMNERSPQLGLRYSDLAVMGALMEQGANLLEPRHVLYYLYFPDAATADRAAEVAQGQGYETTVSEPLPDDTSWRMRSERHHLVLAPEVVRSADDFFVALATTHGGEYDGWEASVVAEAPTEE